MEENTLLEQKKSLEKTGTKLKGVIIKHYPVMSESWGSDGMFFHGRDFKADVVMSLQDIWVLDPNYLSKLKTWIPWS